MASTVASNAARRWCFTLNNYTPVEVDALTSWASNLVYLVFGRETGESGTPHLQGYFILKRRRRVGQLSQVPGLTRAHLEVARGTPEQASTYCKKDGDYSEFGELPTSSQGKRTDFECLKEWCKDRDVPPSDLDLAENFPSLFGRYPKACRRFADLFGPRFKFMGEGVELRPWQSSLENVLLDEPIDRKILFVVDPQGNTGKSWFIKYWLTKDGDSQRLSVGKRDDLAFAIDPKCSVFLFDIPRGQSEFIQYSVLEQLKDGIIFSPKYESSTKVLTHIPHVVVMMNEEPDRTKLSADRYVVMNLHTI